MIVLENKLCWKNWNKGRKFCYHVDRATLPAAGKLATNISHILIKTNIINFEKLDNTIGWYAVSLN